MTVECGVVIEDIKSQVEMVAQERKKYCRMVAWFLLRTWHDLISSCTPSAFVSGFCLGKYCRAMSWKETCEMSRSYSSVMSCICTHSNLLTLLE